MALNIDIISSSSILFAGLIFCFGCIKQQSSMRGEINKDEGMNKKKSL